MLTNNQDDDKYHLYCVDTAFILGLSSMDLVDRVPFYMAGGDVLNQGDKFTSTDHGKGSAACQGIKMTEGWYQQYEGQATIIDRGKLVNAVLFSATEITTGINATEHLPKEWPHYFIAYIDINGSLFHMRGFSSTNVVPCKNIQRYEA